MSTQRRIISPGPERTASRLPHGIARGLAVAGVLAIMGICDVAAARACSCFPETSAEPRFNAATDVISVVLVRAQRGLSHVSRGHLPRIGGRRAEDGTPAVRWVARVEEVLKGCARRGERVIVTTPPSEGLCGIGSLLEKGAQFTVAGAFERAPSGGPRELRATLCTLLDPDPAELTAIRGLGDCCGHACTLTRCETDADCDTTHWCRPSAGAATVLGATCTGLAGIGERCTTSGPPFAERRCAPGLQCARTARPRAPAHAPGTCRLPSSP